MEDSTEQLQADARKELVDLTSERYVLDIEAKLREQYILPDPHWYQFEMNTIHDLREHTRVAQNRGYRQEGSESSAYNNPNLTEDQRQQITRRFDGQDLALSAEEMRIEAQQYAEDDLELNRGGYGMAG